jgi:hypothetical protein
VEEAIRGLPAFEREKPKNSSITPLRKLIRQAAGEEMFSRMLATLERGKNTDTEAREALTALMEKLHAKGLSDVFIGRVFNCARETVNRRRQTAMTKQEVYEAARAGTLDAIREAQSPVTQAEWLTEDASENPGVSPLSPSGCKSLYQSRKA